VEEQGDHQAEIGLRSAPDQPLSAGPGFGERQVDYCFAILPKHFRVWCSLNGWAAAFKVLPSSLDVLGFSPVRRETSGTPCQFARLRQARCSGMAGRVSVISFSTRRTAAISGAACQRGRWPMPRPATRALALPSDIGDVQNVLPLDQADEARATSTGPCPPNAPSSPV
jgi:hypothetical protein